MKVTLTKEKTVREEFEIEAVFPYYAREIVDKDEWYEDERETETCIRVEVIPHSAIMHDKVFKVTILKKSSPACGISKENSYTVTVDWFWSMKHEGKWKWFDENFYQQITAAEFKKLLLNVL